MNNKINFNKDNYVEFNDFNDVMIQAFGIGCSLCYEPQISFVLKDHPKPIGSLIKEQGKNLTDSEVEKLVENPIQEWQKFEDINFDNQEPTFLCDECWNQMIW
ncbi:hypothetical protein CG002_02705 [Mesoplasma florum]|uniref:hypothetical protein n=1 Tax=Mesoplasma florum TaxID=2151 RepID=UPI000D08C076|nr:hypothetical protein [Mesoplasma florum]AVN65248.1 hypothetical protein CG002_02705 [Mesoplasma florum]